MLKSPHHFLTLTATVILASNSSAEVLEVADSISLHGVPISTTEADLVTTSDIVRTDENGNIDNRTEIYVTTSQNPGLVSTSPTASFNYSYGIRERIDFGQPERRWRSFLQFDVSTIPAAELADPNFSATFTVDYIGNLNIVNPGLNVSLGQIVDGAWDSTTTLPTLALSESSTDLGVLITDAAANPDPLPGLTVDITDLVKGWADGSIENFGLTFTIPEGDSGVSNATYFSNATIVTSTDSPAPSGDEIEVTEITLATDGSVSLTFTSAVGNVDIYRSTDLLDFGATPIASNVVPGNFLDITSTDLAKAFYILVPTGVELP